MVVGVASKQHHVFKDRHAHRERASLVEDDRRRVPDLLNRRAAFDNDARLRGAVDTADHRNGHGQNQGTGRRHHQYRQNRLRITRDQPAKRTHDQRHRRQPHGVLVGQPLQGWFFRLGFAHQFHNARILAIRAALIGTHVKGIAHVDAAA